MTKVERTKHFDKELSKVPERIRRKFMLWVQSVERCGIEEVRNKENGYRDKALKGQRKGGNTVFGSIEHIECFMKKIKAQTQ